MNRYIGRIVAVGQAADGRLAALYRVSSRSFPNRTAVAGENKVSIVPKAGHEGDIQKNPYIAYNCARIVCEGHVAVVTNGSQTDPIAEKLAMGYPARDALALSHLALDYEKDDYSTPRISAVIDTRDQSGWLATVRADGVEVRRMPLAPGQLFYVATYEESYIVPTQHDTFSASDAAAACRQILSEGIFAERTNPVSAVAAFQLPGGGFETAALDAV